MTAPIHTERAFEDAVERALLARGYLAGRPEEFDRETALIPTDLWAFLQASQPALWAELKRQHQNLEAGLLDALIKNLHERGTLDVLRHGFKFFGKKIAAAFFKPAHGLNPEVLAQYAQNRLVVRRQVKFNPNQEQSVDLLLSLNGLPIATLELKNSLTGQRVSDARKQYENDRDPKLLLFQFKRRALVHFAVDTDEVSMTTRLAGKKTFFLPFNRGNDRGAGNPALPGESYRTEYLWNDVLAKDSLLDILARFMHLLVEEVEQDGKKQRKETLIFPRYHQLDVVRKLEAAARAEGPGQHYLVQHSAGSGKSNSIAWCAHRLASLHDAQDRKVFDSVVVVTDRRVLDKQLQDTIYQFEHKKGVVERIDTDSNQLARALEAGTAIVITTLQKFPWVTKKIDTLPQRKYAILVDEAHSSQTGEAARTLRAVLAQSNAGAKAGAEHAEAVHDAGVPYGEAALAASEDDEPTYEDEINRVMASRGRQPNLSFFAFTATPKPKTLEVFGRPGPDGKPVAFHEYTMRQAIEEGFILDVLRNYTTYKTYYRLVQRAAEDKTVQKAEAVRALARFMSLHPHNVAQKTEVMIEHFRHHVQRKLGGRAKAMVVTRSRLHAVRYKLAFDAYIRERGYADLAALVAFSGTVRDPDDGAEYTEVKMNGGIQEKELPAKFASPQYQVLLVANKYQTGFDQPLLCAMYVDKKLSGVQAVQTLSRLNRTCPGKDETFVLDFANEAEEILAAFQPFYEQTTVSERADPYQLEQLVHELDAAHIYLDSEVEAFAKVFYRPKQNLTDREHEELHRHLRPAVDRFKGWDDEDARERWRGQLQAFVRLYAFLSQIMPWTDRELEVRYSFGKFLLRRLPRDEHSPLDLSSDVDLHSYRLARIGEVDIQLEKGRTGELKGPTDVGTRKAQDEEVALRDIIEQLNIRFGTEFTERDRLLFDAVIEDGKADEQVKQRAQANTYENFKLSIDDKIEGLMIDRMDRFGGVVTKFLNEDDFKRAVVEHIAREIYDGLRKTG